MPEYSGLKIDASGDISVCPHMVLLDDPIGTLNTEYICICTSWRYERFGCRKESDSECCVVVHLDDMYIHINHDDVSMS